MFSIMVSDSGTQLPLLVEVRMRKMVCVVESALLGLYVALSVVLFGENVPEPVVVHTPVVVPPDTEPFSVVVMLVAQTV